MNDQTFDVPCLKCGGALFKKGPLDDKGHWARDGDSGSPLEYDKTDSFYKCLNCGAKNVVVDEISPHGVPQLRISHLKNGSAAGGVTT